MTTETNLELTNDERLFAMLIYLLSFFMPVIIPLIIWLIKKDESSYIDYHGKAYFNFIISYTIYTFVFTLLSSSGLFVYFLLFNQVTSMIFMTAIPILLLAIIVFLGFVFTIVGAVK